MKIKNVIIQGFSKASNLIRMKNMTNIKQDDRKLAVLKRKFFRRIFRPQKNV